MSYVNRRVVLFNIFPFFLLLFFLFFSSAFFFLIMNCYIPSMHLFYQPSYFCLIICVILSVLLQSTNRYIETNVNFAVRCFKLLGRFLYVSFFCYIYNSDNVFVVTHFLCDFICLFKKKNPETFLFSALWLYPLLKKKIFQFFSLMHCVS